MAFFSLWLLPILTLCLSHGVLHLEASHHVFEHLQTVSTGSTNQPYRTAYHFQPPKNWMNGQLGLFGFADPNGPLTYKGFYHLFYQYNPKGAVWGNIVWAHSVSTDLVNWTPLDHAIYPSQPSDINGCWSGSATFLPGGKPVILYTGIDPQNRQVQNLAKPKNVSDPLLREWVKLPQNPLMAPTESNKINSSSFRDPTTAWLGHDGLWRAIIGSKRDRRGLAILYRSKDFVNWVKAKHPLYSEKGTGMWECPDFFPASIKSSSGVDTSIDGPEVRHVLKVSLDDTKHDYYVIGTYSASKDKFIPDKGFEDTNSVLRYDYGKFYASKTFYDGPKNRRILWGWINESSSVSDDITKGWSGIQAIPRTIVLHKSGKQLVQWPIVEIEKLRTNQVNWPSKVLKGGSILHVSGVSAAQADVEVSFEVTKFEKAEVLDPSWTNPQLLCSRKEASVKGGLGPFGLLVFASVGLEEYTAVFFRIFKSKDKYVVLMCSDQSRSSLNKNNDRTTYGAFLDVDPVHEKLSLRSLIDHSIVESFGGEGKAGISARVYPTLAINDDTHLYAFNNGTSSVKITSLRAWSLKKAHIN
ncbi:Beta-fructofuranosidase, insoluble isoenzyme like [Quillaja saponaria]|uniref:Acid beta-fructofuranosidase n=1 Tax=Quillaja saponaria TaxID=32244 RepID=A0AAD7LRU2_QUISA|nr:Beta-fructofuranosidase, insoluble isoenzyme like [Quillaja saponaria]